MYGCMVGCLFVGNGSQAVRAAAYSICRGDLDEIILFDGE